MIHRVLLAAIICSAFNIEAKPRGEITPTSANRSNGALTSKLIQGQNKAVAQLVTTPNADTTAPKLSSVKPALIKYSSIFTFGKDARGGAMSRAGRNERMVFVPDQFSGTKRSAVAIKARLQQENGEVPGRAGFVPTARILTLVPVVLTSGLRPATSKK
jgi:hypothetical protein